MNGKGLDDLALALFKYPLLLFLEPPAPATWGFSPFHKEGRTYLPLVSLFMPLPIPVTVLPPQLLSLLISCISIKYRLKCHFFQKALPEPTVLSGSLIPGALHQLNIPPSHFSELCPLPFETWNNLGKNTTDMDEGEAWETLLLS